MIKEKKFATMKEELNNATKSPGIGGAEKDVDGEREANAVLARGRDWRWFERSRTLPSSRKLRVRGGKVAKKKEGRWI